jgi:hypothetical protein
MYTTCQDTYTFFQFLLQCPFKDSGSPSKIVFKDSLLSLVTPCYKGCEELISERNNAGVQLSAINNSREPITNRGYFLRFEAYSRRGMYNQRKKYNRWGFHRHFYHVKIKFSTFSFCSLNFAQFATRNKKNSSKKLDFKGEKFSSKKLIFLNRRFFTAVFLNNGQFLPKLKPYSDRSRSTQHRFQKSGGLRGDFFELFSLRRTSFGFSKNPCVKSITNRICVLRHCSTAPPSPGHRWADGRTLAGRSSLIFYRILINFFNWISKTKLNLYGFFVHYSVVITFRVILNNVRKLIILTRFFIFDLDENILNDIIADFFWLV